MAIFQSLDLVVGCPCLVLSGHSVIIVPEVVLEVDVVAGMVFIDFSKVDGYCPSY